MFKKMKELKRTFISKRSDPPSMYIGEGNNFQGEISFAGLMYVLGTVEGKITPIFPGRDDVVVGTTGVVHGVITNAKVVEIFGEVIGEIVADEVHIFSGGRLEGDITVKNFVSEFGAFFQGKCRMDSDFLQAGKLDDMGTPQPMGMRFFKSEEEVK